MSVLIGTATDYADLLNQLDGFLTGTGMALSPSFVGVGTGTIAALGGSAGVAETITVTFTSATAFGVVGSVSGALGAGVVGTAFSSTKVNLTVTAGSTAFVSGDVFTFAVTPPWISLRRVAGSEMIWEGPGNGGTDQILVGAKTFFDAGGDYYNWRLGGFTAYSAGAAFNQQPGFPGGSGQTNPSPVLNLWNGSIPFWFIASGRRVIVVAKVSTVYVAAYLGFLESYTGPSAFPYPLVVGGSMNFQGAEPAAGSASWRWSAASNNFPIPMNITADYASQLLLRLPIGTWRGFDLTQGSPWGHIWPYQIGMQDWRTNLDGSYSLLPIVLFDETPNCYGELDGVVAVTGYQNAAEDTITVGRAVYVVVQNVNHTDKKSYFAVRMN